MNEKVIDLAYQLKELINSDNRFNSLIEKEKKMENDVEVQVLFQRKDEANSKYNDMVRFFGEYSKEAEQSLKSFYEAKKEFDSHQLVQDYLSSYQEFKALLDKINEILFEGFETDLCPKKE